jgi:hypothetical protein
MKALQRQRALTFIEACDGAIWPIHARDYDT